VARLHASQGDRAYTRTWLAKRLGVDRKTLRKYLRDYGVGWPPFAQGQPYLQLTPECIITEVPPEFTEEFGYTPEQLLGHHARILQHHEGEGLRPENVGIWRVLIEPLLRGERDHAEWTSYIYDASAVYRDVNNHWVVVDGHVRWEFR